MESVTRHAVNMYVADMILEKVGSAVVGLYPEGDAIYQDDGTTMYIELQSLWRLLGKHSRNAWNLIFKQVKWQTSFP